MKIRFLIFAPILALLPGPAAVALAEGVESGALNGLWFSCEYAHSKIPPTDNCVMLDDDGFLIEGNRIWHMKVQDGDKDGCRGDRAGNCFLRARERITAKKKKIGDLQLTADGGIVEYMWCGQAYKVTRGPRWAEVRPTGDRCAWTSEKTYYLARWQGEVRLVE